MFKTEWQQKGLDLHHRLLEADSTAPADLFEIFLPYLLTELARKYPNEDTDLIWDAVSDAAAKYIEKPQIYDPTGKNLHNFLKMAAEGDLLNALARQKRHFARNQPLDDVALSTLAGNINIESEFIFKQEFMEKLQNRQKLNHKVAADNPLDQQLMLLLQRGERHTSEWARVLEIAHLPKEEQEIIVKKHKDRLKLRQKRQQAKG